MKKYLIVSIVAFSFAFVLGGHKVLAAPHICGQGLGTSSCTIWSCGTGSCGNTFGSCSDADGNYHVPYDYFDTALQCSGDGIPTGNSSTNNGKISPVKNIATAAIKNSNTTTTTIITKATITKAQTLLNKKGFNCGKVDGTLGKNTKTALTNFQKANKLPVTGKADTATMDLLNKDSN